MQIAKQNASVTVTHGNSATDTLSFNGVNGFTGTLNFNVLGLLKPGQYNLFDSCDSLSQSNRYCKPDDSRRIQRWRD